MARGVSLLEVLIAISVIAVGMLFVAALIPVGRFSVVESTKADRSAACGRSAMSEVKARGLLHRVDPSNPSQAKWFWPDGTPAANLTWLGNTWALHPRLVGQAFVIDPLFVGEARVKFASDPKELEDNLTKPAVSRFPYPGYPPANLNYRLPRLTLDGAGGVAALSVYQRIFGWEDDLQFARDEDEPDRRPAEERLWSDGSVAPTTAAAGVTPVVGASEGNYSWMMMLVPSPTETPPTLPNGQPDMTALATDHQRTYRVSIVVFYKRDLSFDKDPSAGTPSERSVEIAFPGGGYGGGDAVLSVPGTVVIGNQGDAEEYLDVKPGRWIMVYDAMVDSRLPGGIRRIAQWYRVVAVDEVEPGTRSRRVTLAGPDWDVMKQLAPRAALVDGVIGVYTKTIKVDDGSTWN